MSQKFRGNGVTCNIYHFFFQLLAAAIAEHVRMVRRVIQDFGIPPKDIWCFDEIRIYASSQDLNTMTLEFASVRDPVVRKIANPREAYTGIVLASGDGENLAMVLVTNKALPPGATIHEMTLDQRKWDKVQKKVVITPTRISFCTIEDICVLKVPPGFKAWCSGLVTEAFCRMFMTKCDRPTILQADRAPGHIDPVFNRLMSESGRFLLWTPAGGSGFVQANDDTINAPIQKAFDEYATDWLIEKVMELYRSGNDGAVANPTLTEICQILALALRRLTPASQRRAFQHCLLTLPTDGSQDKEKGGKSLMKLMGDHNESLVPDSNNSAEHFPNLYSEDVKEGRLTSIWESLIGSIPSFPKTEFRRDPPLLPAPKGKELRALTKILGKKKTNRLGFIL